MDRRKTNKKLLPIVIIIFALLALLVFWPEKSPPKPPMTKQQQDSVRIAGQFIGDRHIASMAAIQQKMNDPESFDFISSRHWPLDSAGCIGVLTVFTGKNLYGGVVKQSCLTYIDSTGAVFEMQFQ